jgi:hypothetical protein
MRGSSDDPRPARRSTAVYQLEFVDLSPVTRTLADGSVVAGLPEPGTGSAAAVSPSPVGVAYPGPMTAPERVVMLHDPEVRQLIEDLVEALAERMAVLADLETSDGAAEHRRLVERVQVVLARN